MVEEAAQIREANSQELSDHEDTLEKLKTDLDAATEIKDTAEAAEETAKSGLRNRLGFQISIDSIVNEFWTKLQFFNPLPSNLLKSGEMRWR